jgi:hypothetical protein
MSTRRLALVLSFRTVAAWDTGASPHFFLFHAPGGLGQRSQSPFFPFRLGW